MRVNFYTYTIALLATLLQYPETPMTDLQVCFHWHHFCDLLKFMTVHYGIYSTYGYTNKATYTRCQTVVSSYISQPDK